VEVCAYEDAIALKERIVDGLTVRRAVITAANCSGCGACVSACPQQAIDVQGWSLEQYTAMVEALSADLPVQEKEVTI
jgi:heterodisulfide reductase subunit A